MRSQCFFIILVIAIHISDNLAAEICPKENCMASSCCESPWIGAECPNKQDTCCSIVKSEYRTVCRHHGGECMNKCNKNLQRVATDCPANKVCCVLV